MAVDISQAPSICLDFLVSITGKSVPCKVMSFVSYQMVWLKYILPVTKPV